MAIATNGAENSENLCVNDREEIGIFFWYKSTYVSYAMALTY